MGPKRLTFYQTTIGKKVVMAISGLILIGFVIIHMLGHLQIFEELIEAGRGQRALDDYAAFFHSRPIFHWTVRLILLGAVLAHFLAASSLIRQNRAARSQRYMRKINQRTTYAAQTMIYGGITLILFIIYHLLHLTCGLISPTGFTQGAVYQNIVVGFRVPWISGVYVVAQLSLGLHLYHGIWSLLQTLGLHRTQQELLYRRVATFIAIGVAGGNLSIPVAVLSGLFKI